MRVFQSVYVSFTMVLTFDDCHCWPIMHCAARALPVWHARRRNCSISGTPTVHIWVEVCGLKINLLRTQWFQDCSRQTSCGRDWPRTIIYQCTVAVGRWVLIHGLIHHAMTVLSLPLIKETRGQSNLTKSASRGAHSPVRGHPTGSKVVPLNSWGMVSY